MCIMEELKSNPTLSEVVEIYNKGNKIAIQNDYDIFIGFTDRVFLNGQVLNIEKEDIKCIKGVHLVKGNQINVKANTILKIEFIYIDPYEEEYMAFVKPFRGKHKDYGVSVCIFSNGKTVDDKVYEIREVCDEDMKIHTVGGVTGSRKELAEHFGISERTLYDRMKRGMSLEKALLTPVKKRGSGEGRLYSVKGYTGTKDELAEYFGVPKQEMYKRTRRGMSLVDALTLGIAE